MIEYKRTAVQRANQNGLYSYCIKLIAYKRNSIDEESLCYVISHAFIDNPVILLLLKCQEKNKINLKNGHKYPIYIRILYHLTSIREQQTFRQPAPHK